ncbi:hypothetical protein DL96DRAFT_1708056 [Flagelloscypha sp. PMI_526]|nr:hypothetical protein DL96DRAFT_1708056 [Flagelloscypha sp. PMI_526]
MSVVLEMITHLPPSIFTTRNATKRRTVAKLGADQEKRRSKTKSTAPLRTEGKGERKRQVLRLRADRELRRQSSIRLKLHLRSASALHQLLQIIKLSRTPSANPNSVDYLFNEDPVGPSFPEDMALEDIALEDIMPEDIVPPPPLVLTMRDR